MMSAVALIRYAITQCAAIIIFRLIDVNVTKTIFGGQCDVDVGGKSVKLIMLILRNLMFNRMVLH